jgi:cyclohexanone monooxygenase
VAVRADVQERFADRVQRLLRGSVWQSGCTSWTGAQSSDV